MYDFRPVAHLLGFHLIALAGCMLGPFFLDVVENNGNAEGFFVAAFLTLGAGLTITFGTRHVDRGGGFSRPQAFLLTVILWTLIPGFGALPFVFGEPAASYTDAFFEAMSGVTTTGSTVFTGLDDAPRGMLLWRAMLQWIGGLGIVIVAILFFPTMRIGGMQFFRTVSFDVSGTDVIPQATQIATDLTSLYLTLTLACTLAYAAAGMNVFDAICHAMTTIPTGGFANYDASFGHFGPLAQYASILFMALSAMPFIRFIELAKGRGVPLWQDQQVQAYLATIAVAASVLAFARAEAAPAATEQTFRDALFNVISVMTTTGFATADYSLWGGLAGATIFVISLIGGCTASTTGAAKVFRYQVLYSALIIQMRRIHMPHGVFLLRYQGRTVEPEVVASVMAFFFIYVSTLACMTIILSLMGLDSLTAISAPIATVTNVGPGLGPVIGPAGNFSSLPDAAKWLLSFGMLIGRLEFFSVLVLLMPLFWQR